MATIKLVMMLLDEKIGGEIGTSNKSSQHSEFLHIDILTNV